MTGWPQAVVRCGPIARARMSEVPPAAKGTTMRIGLLGDCCACAGGAGRLAARAAARAAAKRVMDILLLRLRLGSRELRLAAHAHDAHLAGGVSRHPPA